ncbi:hypothetical protein [Teredinibacter purpureus]|uniref:hypothetical protein n=1 Tax=Teredinibacter purpureus TaxID=2731756 RepID=UPI001F457585|nr:hypothetical protein [Teredinibacter purpureus]
MIPILGLPLYISEHDIEATNDQTQLQYMQTMPLFSMRTQMLLALLKVTARNVQQWNG